MKIVIEYGVPLYRKVTGAKRKYPFDKMGIGDSFEIPGKKAASARQCAFKYGKEHNKRFSLRKTGTDTFRCWRIK